MKTNMKTDINRRANTARRFIALFLCLCCVLCVSVTAWADPSTEIDLENNELMANGARWILSGIAWIILIGGAYALLKFILNKNTGGIIVTALLTAAALFFVLNPSKMIQLAQKLSDILGL